MIEIPSPTPRPITKISVLRDSSEKVRTTYLYPSMRLGIDTRLLIALIITTHTTILTSFRAASLPFGRQNERTLYRERVSKELSLIVLHVYNPSDADIQ